MINPKASAIAFGTILGADAFLHVFFPAIGINFLVWNIEAYKSFIAFGLGAVPTVLNAVLALVYGFIFGAVLGHVYSIIYNAVDKNAKKH